MKVQIYKTKFDPVYKISLYNNTTNVPLEDDYVSDEFVERYQRVMKEFDEVQTTIKQLGHTQGYW